MNFEAVDRAAGGKWHSILPMLGIDAKYLVNKHGPCPMCEGTDRFRFDDKGTGMYFCNGCGAGNGFQLLQKFNNWDFNKALNEVAAVVGCASESVPKSQGGDPRKALRQVMKDCTKDRHSVIEYLKGRGLSVFPDCLREHPGLDYYDDGKVTGTYPAMIATISSVKGKALSIHRTYLTDVDCRKKTMPPVKALKGAAIQLFTTGEVLGLAEGIETAIAAHELTRMKGEPMAVWSAINTTMMESFEVPDGVKRLVIFADNDKNYAGQKSAYILAHRLALKGMEVSVNVPPDVGDYLDVLNTIKAKRGHSYWPEGGQDAPQNHPEAVAEREAIQV